ncbi:MAG: FAD:protein FMN transferase, partial [Phycisphaerales bacterium]
ISSCLIELGGDMVLGRPPPDAPAWRIAVQTEDEPTRPSVLELTNVGVATSGDTEQFVEIASRRYSHIVDPRTGLGLTNRIAVTVIAHDATTADALASAISVLGPARGLALLRRFPGTSALVEIRTEHGIERFGSDSFPLPATTDIQ